MKCVPSPIIYSKTRGRQGTILLCGLSEFRNFQTSCVLLFISVLFCIMAKLSFICNKIQGNCHDLFLFFSQCLTHLCRMDSSNFTLRTNIRSVWLDFIINIFFRNSCIKCKQCGRRILRRLIWVYTVCLYCFYRTLDLNGLIWFTIFFSVMFNWLT